MNNQYIYDDIKNATRLIFDSVYGIEKTKTITSWSHISIPVDEIVEFTVLEKVFKIHQFKSIEYVYDFLE